MNSLTEPCRCESLLPEFFKNRQGDYFCRGCGLSAWFGKATDALRPESEAVERVVVAAQALMASETLQEVRDAYYAQGVENGMALASKRITELEAALEKIGVRCSFPALPEGTPCGWCKSCLARAALRGGKEGA